MAHKYSATWLAALFSLSIFFLQVEQESAELQRKLAEAEKAAQQPSTATADLSQMEGLQAKNKELKDKLDEAKGYNNLLCQYW